jgi:ferritin-like metal-binding protein YciE
MLTKDDLQAIGALIRHSEECIRKDTVTKRDLEANNRLLGTIFKVELAATKQEIMAAIKGGFQETTNQIKRVEQKLDRAVQGHEERLEIIEEHLGLPHKN